MALTRTTKNWTTGEVTTETLFSGAVLALHWNSTRVMSDVWETLPNATVFNAATGNVEVVWRDREAAATDTVDATPEAVVGANAWLLKTATATRKAEWDSRVWKAVKRAKEVGRGKTVTVVKGRKVPKGTTGEVFWMGEGRYGWRVGFNDSAGATHWTALSNVEVTNPDEHFPFEEFAVEPDHGAEALKALNSTARDAWGHKFGAGVSLSAGEDRVGFNDWFTVKTVAATAAAA